MAGKLKPIRMPLRRRLTLLSRSAMPLAVWMGALAGVVLLLDRQSVPLELMGIAEADRREVSALSSGLITTVAVRAFDPVQAGQVVALVDDTAIVAELETARAEHRRLRALIDAERQRLIRDVAADASDRLDDRRRFETDAEEYRSNILELRTQLSSDRIELERLRLEMERIAGLVVERAVSARDHDDSRLRHDSLATAIEENRRLLAQDETNLAAAIERLSGFGPGPAPLGPLDPVLEPLRLALEVQERRIDELLVERRSLALRSPIRGLVSAVLRGPGETVRAGEPILIVTAEHAERLVVFVNEEQAELIAPQSEVTLRRGSAPGRLAGSRVVRVGPAIEPLPERLWRFPSMPEWGRPVVIAAVPGWDLLPGEVLGVRLELDFDPSSR